MAKGKFVFILLAVVLIASSAFAAPEGEKDSTTEVENKKVENKKTTAEDRQTVLVSDDTWNTWLSSSSWNIATASLGALFIVAGLGVGFYYYYYVNVVDTNAANYQGQGFAYAGQAQGTQPAWNAYQNYATGRSLDTTPGSRWNFTKVLEYIDIAQKTYEGFDWQKLSCQKRVLCELAQKDTWAGETGRKITNNYLLTIMDALDGVPVPRMIEAYLAEYKEAISQGKNSSKDCGAVYGECLFSIKEVIAQAGQKKKRF